jgi:hypothetical protein
MRARPSVRQSGSTDGRRSGSREKQRPLQGRDLGYRCPSREYPLSPGHREDDGKADAGWPQMNATFFGLAFLAALNPKLLGVDLLLMNSHGRRRAPVPVTTQAGAGRHSKGHDWAQRILSKPRYALVLLIGAACGTPGGEYLAALHVLVTGKSSKPTQVIAVVAFVLIEFLLVIIPVVLLLVRPEDTRAGIKRAQDWLMSHARELIAVVLLLVGAYMAVNGLARLL